jgi:hypothetical protein
MITNETSLRYYSFFVHFNPFLRYTEWDKIAEKTQKYFVDFINENDYGEDVISITFNFFVEKEVDINKQYDNISTASYYGISKTARLNVHFDYNYFINASDELKYQTTLNGILFLLNYWNSNLIIPKGTPLQEIINDYKNKLIKDNYLREGDENIYIKINNPFRFNFMLHLCYGIKQKEILFDTNEIEKYLNNNLYKHNFGKSINEIFFSYDMLDFDKNEYKKYVGKETEYKYGRKRDLTIVEQYDIKLIKNNTKDEQIKHLHNGMLKSIDRIEEMKRRPKDFYVKGFYKIIDKLMNEYEKNNGVRPNDT